MLKEKFIHEVAVSQKLPLSIAYQAVDGVLNTIADALCKGEDIEIRGFGKFKVQMRSERTARDLRNGGTIVVPAHKVAVFHPCKTLRERLNGKEARK